MPFIFKRLDYNIGPGMKLSLLIIALMSVASLSFLFCSVYAISQVTTPVPGITIPINSNNGFVGSTIEGHVLDANGQPVPNAVITLWYNGQIANPSGGSVGNPQISRLYSYNTNYSGDVGFFNFIVYDTGQFTLTAQIDGYNSSTGVFVSNDSPGITNIVNITMSGYRVPVLSEEQLAYTGGVTGVVLDNSGIVLNGINVSLWQNDQLVSIPSNPQIASLDGNRFLFTNLSPGHYELFANTMSTSLPPSYVDDAYVDVYNSTVTMNITMHNYTYLNMNPPSTPPDFTPPPSPCPSPSLPPSPFPDGLLTLLVVSAVTLICLHEKRP
jgi:hypothetical protein